MIHFKRTEASHCSPLGTEVSPNCLPFVALMSVRCGATRQVRKSASEKRFCQLYLRRLQTIESPTNAPRSNSSDRRPCVYSKQSGTPNTAFNLGVFWTALVSYCCDRLSLVCLRRTPVRRYSQTRRSHFTECAQTYFRQGCYLIAQRATGGERCMQPTAVSI